ncbi:hypothetical protein AN958_11503 [Leucoagaricus sp. SymC.cos]|nr:hypothetical protein AN958_11503 [Leucoagaricus sp. SymC.cos]
MEHIAANNEQVHVSRSLSNQRADRYLSLNESYLDPELNCPIDEANVALISQETRIKLLQCIKGMLDQNLSCRETHTKGIFNIIRHILLERNPGDEISPIVSETVESLSLWVCNSSKPQTTRQELEHKIDLGVPFCKFLYVCKDENARRIVEAFLMKLDGHIRDIFRDDLPKFEHILAQSPKFRHVYSSLNTFRAAATTSVIATRTTQVRRQHQVALAFAHTEPPVPFEDPKLARTGRGRRRRLGGMSVRGSLTGIEPGLELEKKVQALQSAVDEEETSISPPYYAEEDLTFLYEDLLSIPPQPPKISDDVVSPEAQLAEDKATVREAEERLVQSFPEAASLTLGDDQQKVTFYGMKPFRRVLRRAQAVVAQLEEMRGVAMRGTDLEGHPVAGPSQVSVPISVLSLKEFESIIRICVYYEDWGRALATLQLMEVRQTLTNYYKACKANILVQDTEYVIANFITSPTDRQRHLHVKAHLKNTPEHEIPTSALKVLHAYEEKALPVPMQTYTSCIGTLFATKSSLAHAQAWDLFSHMRYVAHPDPDVWLYTVMIQGCAESRTGSSSPEKALDLWTEMTVDKKLEPTDWAYNAIIMALAKSGERRFINEAYRLAKQMFNGFRDARGVSAFGPNRFTFCALLEGAKRIGDLARARWILAEIVRGGSTGLEADSNEEIRIDKTIMTHIFQTYALYRPPFKREATVVVSEESDRRANDSSSTESAASSKEAAEVTSEEFQANVSLTAFDAIPSFSHIPPQSHQEVLREATFLFQRILHDIGVLPALPEQQGPHFSPSLVGKFSGVTLTRPLLNAYISVFLRHGPLQLAERMFWSIFKQFSVPINARIYVDTLEKCSFAKKDQREVAMRFSEDIWTKWKELEDAGVDSHDSTRALDPRLIERAYIARLRLFSIAERMDRAMHVVHTFVQRYPPTSLRTPPEKPDFRSTRTSLVGARPLVRMTTTSDVPEDGVPPLLTFRDLEVLHQRLIVFGMYKEIGYLKWVAKSYEWMLRVRRDEAFRARPTKSSGDFVPEIEEEVEPEVES